jgi:hypothetical protein
VIGRFAALRQPGWRIVLVVVLVVGCLCYFEDDDEHENEEDCEASPALITPCGIGSQSKALFIWRASSKLRPMNRTAAIRKFAAAQGVSEKEALKLGMEAKSKESVEKGRGGLRKCMSTA